MDALLQKKYISSKEASELSGYHSDYLARLCRSGVIVGERVGRAWLINKDSLQKFVASQETQKKKNAEKLSQEREKEYRRAQAAREAVQPQIVPAPIPSPFSPWYQQASAAIVAMFVVTGALVLAQHELVPRSYQIAVENIREIGSGNSQLALVNDLSLVRSAHRSLGEVAVAASDATLSLYIGMVQGAGEGLLATGTFTRDLARNDARSGLIGSWVGLSNEVAYRSLAGIYSLGDVLLIASNDAPTEVASAYNAGVEGWVYRTQAIAQARSAEQFALGVGIGDYVENKALGIVGRTALAYDNSKEHLARSLDSKIPQNTATLAAAASANVSAHKAKEETPNDSSYSIASGTNAGAIARELSFTGVLPEHTQISVAAVAQARGASTSEQARVLPEANESLTLGASAIDETLPYSVGLASVASQDAAGSFQRAGEEAALYTYTVINRFFHRTSSALASFFAPATRLVVAPVVQDTRPSTIISLVPAITNVYNSLYFEGVSYDVLERRLAQLREDVANDVYDSADHNGGFGGGGGGSGSVTSVDISGGTTGLSFIGGPITSTGSFTLEGILGIANGGTGTSSAPSYGQLLIGDGVGGYSLVATSSLGIGAGTGNPGGVSTQVQFNDSGLFAGDAGFTYNNIDDRLTVVNASTTNLTATNLFATALSVGSDLITDITGAGLVVSGGALTVNTIGDWTGTFDGQEGSYYLDRANHTGTQLASTISDFASTVNSFINGSTTIPKTYTSNTFTGSQSFTGGLAIGSLNGPLQANNGAVSATTSIGVLYGGTGLTTAPSYGQLLVGNGSGGYTLTATSSLGIVTSAITSIGPAGQSQTGPAIVIASSTSGTDFAVTGAGNTLTFALPSASSIARGLLTPSDWSLFNNKISSTSLSGGSVISYNSSTGVITTTGGTFGAGDYVFPNKLTAPYASSTALSSTYASSTSLFASNFTLGALSGVLKATAGVVSVATAGVDYENVLSFAYPLVRSSNTISLAFGTTTQNFWSAHNSFTSLFATNASSTNATTTNFGLNNETFTDLTGSGLSNVGGVLTLNATGDWTGTFDGQEGTYYLNRANHTGTQLASTINDFNSAVNSFINGSTTIPKTYTSNTFTGAQVLNGGLTLGTLNGPLQANNGVVSATSSIGVLYGGTGLAVAPSYGQVLVGNAAGGYTLTATSSLGISAGTGISSIGPTGQLQVGPTVTIASSSTGTDFTVTGSSNTITFNLPSASATARGLLTSGDWSVFNNKISSTSLSGGSVISYNSSTGVITTTGGTFGSGDYVFPGKVTVPYASSTALSSSYASSTNAFFGNLSIASLSGVLKATAGVVSTALVNLTSDVTGILPVANGGTGRSTFTANTVLLGNGTSAVATTSAGTNGQVLALVGGVPTWVATTTLSDISGTLAASKGGTGQTTYAVGDLLYADTTTSLARLPVGTAGQVLKVTAGLPQWGADLTTGGGGGAGAWATTTDSLAIYPTDTSDVVIVGNSATTTTTSIFEVSGRSYFSNNVSIGTTSTTNRLNIGGNSNFDGTGQFSGLLTLLAGLNVNSETFTDLTGTGLSNVGGALTLNATGDWTGTFDGQEGTYYLNRANHTGTQLASTISDFASTVNSFINGSTTIPKTYTSNTFTGGQTFSGAVAIGSLNGPLQANNGVVSATTSIGVLYGGTGLTSAPSYGQLLVGNAAGGYTLTATSSLGLITSAVTAIGPTGQTQTGPTITVATSTSSFNGLTVSTTVVGAGNALTFTPALSGTLNNSGLANSTVSYGGVTLSLGGTDATPAFDLTDATGLPIATGVSGLGSGIATFLGTPTSANLATAITNETGSGALVFGTAPTISGATLTGTTIITNASTSAISANTLAVGGTGTTSISSTGALTTTYASTTGISAAYASSTSAFFGNLSIASLTGVLKATAGAVSTGLVNLASEVSGILPVANGGTGWGNITANALLLGNGTGALATTSAGTNGQVLALVGGVPTWVATTSINNGVSSIQQTGGGAAQTGAITFATSSVTSNGITIGLNITNSGSAFTFTPTRSGTLNVSGGGTGQTSLNSGELVYGRGSSGVQTVATSSLAVGSEFSYSGTLGALVGGTGGTLTLANNGVALTKLATIGANTILGNPTGATGNVTAFATSSLGIAISDTTGTLGISRGGTGTTTAPQGQLLYGGASSYQSVATSSVTVGSGLSYSGTFGSVVGGVGGTLSLNTTGDWTGTFDGQEGTYYLNRANHTGTQLASTISDFNSAVNSFINGSTTIPKTYTSNIFTAAQSFTGGLTIGTLNGPLQANNGVVSATTSIGVLYGGTGLTSAPTYGQLLVGNAAGGYTLTATSSLGLVTGAGGSNTQVQYNNGGALGGDSGFTYDAAADRATITYASTTGFTSTYASSTSGFFGSLSIANLTGVVKATAGAISTGLVNLASEVSGILPVANGGTGWGNFTANTVLIGNGTGAIATTSAGTNGQVLALVGGVPTWVATTSINNGVSSIQQTGGGAAQTGAITFATSSATSNGVTIGLNITNSGNAFTFTPTRSGSLSVAGGGTGQTSFTSGQLVYGNGTNALTSVATSSLAVGSEFSYSGTLGALVGGTGGTLTLANNGVALTKLATIGANTILGNPTGATGNVTAFATSSLGIALTDTTGTLGISRGGTGTTTAPQGQLLYGGASSYQSVATSSVTIGTGLSYSGTFGSVVGGAGGTLSLNTSGDWTGTFDGQEGTYYLNRANHTGTQLASTISDFNSAVNSFIHGSTTIPKTYTSNTFTAGQTFSGAVTIGSLNGPLQANAGVVSATTSIGVLYGGTGLTSAPSYGQVLVGNALGGYTLTATSSLGLTNGSGTVNTGTTGQFPYYAANGTAVTATSTLFLTTAGNIGVGTNGPVDYDGVYSGSYRTLAIDGSSSGLLDVMANGIRQGTLYNFGSTFRIGNASSNNLALITNDTEQVVIDPSGNVTLSTGGALTLNTGLNGPLQANNGLVSATSSIGVKYGGTGLTSAPTYGQLLVGNAAGGYTLTATSSLGLVTSAVTAIGPTGQTQTGPTVTIATSSTAYNGLTASTTVTGTGNTLTFANTLSGILGVGGGGTGTSTWMNGALAFYDGTLGTLSQAASQAALFFDKTNGRLGIGTSTPGNLLSIQSTTANQFVIGYDASNYGSLSVNSSGNLALSSSGTALQLVTGGATRWTVNGSDLTANSSTGVQIRGTSGASLTAPNIIPNRNDTTTGFAAGVSGNINAIVGGVELTRWTSTGFGIGSSTPTFKLSVEGSSSLGNTATAGSFIATTSTASVFPYASSTAITAAYASSTAGFFSGLTATNATTTNFGLNSETFTDLTGTGLSNVGGALTLNVTGDWTGTFDGQEGTYYLNRANHTGTQLAATISDFSSAVNSFIHASTTIPKTYTSNTFTAAQTFNGGLTISTLNGPLQANAGVVSATTSIGVLYGGTGLTSAPSYGQVLVGNALGGYTLTATSSLGISGGSGTVGSGTIGQFPYYAANGTTLTATSTLFLATTGSVGIGTTTPQAALSIANTLNGFSTTPQLALESSANNTALVLNNTATGGRQWYIVSAATASTIGSSFNIYDNTAGANRLVINSSGNIGIGTTTPNAQLNIWGAGQTTSALNTSGALGGSIVLNSSTGGVGDGGAVVFGSNASNFSYRFAAIKGLATDNSSNGAGDLAFSTRGSSADATLTERLIIRSNGNVGLGTSTPSDKLHIGTTFASNQDSGLTIQPNNSLLKTRFGLKSDANGVYRAAITMTTTAGADTEVISLPIGTSIGNVGIGTTTPTGNGSKLFITGDATGATTGQLTINGSTNPRQQLIIGYDTTNDYAQIQAIKVGTAFEPLLLNPGGGNVGVGTTSPWGLFSVNPNALGSGVPSFVVGSSTATQLIVTNGGNVGIGTAAPTSKLDIRGGDLTISRTSSGAGDAAIYFGSTTNNYIFGGNSSNIMAFATNGSERVRIDGSGNVGIGNTATTTAKLSVTGVIRSNVDFGAVELIAANGSGFRWALDASNNLLLQGTSNTFGAVSVTPLSVLTTGSSLIGDSNLSVCTGGACPTGSPSGNGNIIAETAIGIASSTPWAGLSIASGKAIVVGENTLATSTSMTIDWRNGNQQLIRLGTAGTTISFSGFIEGQKLVLTVCNPGATGGAITWGTQILWSGGTAPTQTTTANKCDVWSFLATMATSSVKIFGTQSANF